MSGEQPVVVVLGGINGAGKTTASRQLLANHFGMKTFVNADIIATGLNAFSPEAAAFQAGKVMIARLRELEALRMTFAFESTLSGRMYIQFLKGLRTQGYRVELYYFWLPTPQMAIDRVKQRVASGGHNIPEETIHQRYLRSCRNFWNDYRLLSDLWMMYDNSGGRPRLVARGKDNGDPIVHREKLWAVFQRQVDED